MSKRYLPPSTIPATTCRLLSTLFFTAALSLAAGAQSPRAVTVGADNDAFNFWLPPWQRTDREYTSGVCGALEFDGPVNITWLNRLRRRVRAPNASGRATHTFSIGQAIYTGDSEQASREHRPNAGWLFLQASERDSSEGRVQEMSVAAGVVGPPALGEPVQRLFHSLGPEYQRPIDWARQLPFEPGFVARLTRTTMHREYEASRWRGAILSHLGGAVGTILTSATAGGSATANVQLGGESPRRGWPRLELRGDLRAHLVVRDEFLDGTFFTTSEWVGRRLLYDEERFAVGLRWAQVSVGYRVTRTGVQYNGQPGPAQWSSLELELRRR